jgi:hypothetical protein
MGIEGIDAKTYPVGVLDEKFLLPRWEVLLNGKRIKRASHVLIVWGNVSNNYFDYAGEKTSSAETFKQVSLYYRRLTGDLEM